MSSITRENFLEKLRKYVPALAENQSYNSMVNFIKTIPQCFERTWLEGHVTASAWLLDSKRKRALLMHHKKLNKWIQPGGHADGDCDVLKVALKEAREETGIENIIPISEEIFDIDVHSIPARGEEAEHLHYDVRFLLQAKDHDKLIANHESIELKWFTLTEILELDFDASVKRMAKKWAEYEDKTINLKENSFAT